MRTTTWSCGAVADCKMKVMIAAKSYLEKVARRAFFVASSCFFMASGLTTPGRFLKTQLSGQLSHVSYLQQMAGSQRRRSWAASVPQIAVIS